ncbi:hypothetical protein PRIPAC_79143 [Pristionchus pacificus]|uniref:Uncharacterized protein n=1 Tax=Pristionchus pacificus TaxID=54126 RepID=A0A2A6C2A3_PRIPA|nr:hypothetical protein PRIPAC_79143 [Pristionchus pacificus]|eukprot:PDM72153.1 hypothetical protein PRIPAC_38587 [Pristionchus pacificus]
MHPLFSKTFKIYDDMIVKLIDSLSLDSINENDFDCKALLHFFNQPTITVPNEWIAHWPRITLLVNQAIQRFPSLRGIDFNIAQQ